MSVLPFVLAAMASLAPAGDHTELAESIARVVDAEAPLFAGDDDHRRTAALVVAVAFRESSFRTNAVGDHGRSFCALQIHRSSGGSKKLLEDTDECIRTGLTMLRQSSRICSAHPLAWYAGGPQGCDNAHAQRVSRDRMAIAKRLVSTVHEDAALAER